MKTIKKLINGNDKDIGRKSVIWNMLSSLEYSLQSALLLLVVTRVLGLRIAGVFTIAYTVTQMMSTIGSYAMRSFQVSDVLEEYKFTTYYSSRLVSTFAMIIITIIYSIISGYNGTKFLLVIILCAYRSMESIEDVIHGEIQRRNRLDVAAKIVAIRIFFATIVFVMVLIATRNIVYSSIAFSLAGIGISILLNRAIINDYKNIDFGVRFNKVFKLLLACLPICLGGFLYNYLGNAPKYSIDRTLPEELQTIFNVLFIPIFVINMLNSFIFKPMILTMGELWNANNKKGFAKLIFRQLLIIAGLTVIIAIGGGTIGLDLFELIYAVDLGKYRLLFVMLFIFGGFSATSAYLNVVLTIMRRQKVIIVSYFVALIFDIVAMDRLTTALGLMGAGIGYGISMFSVVVIMSIAVIYYLVKKRTSYSEEK